MEYKAFFDIEVKEVGEGKVRAKLATKGMIDRDKDVLIDNLVGGRQLVAIKPQHKWDHVNLGVADVYETATSLEALLFYNLDIPSAKDWYEATRFSHAHGHRFQYSFGFQPTDSERGIHEGQSVRFLKAITIAEVSPVLIGASIGSETLSVKALSPENQHYERRCRELTQIRDARQAADPIYQKMQAMGKRWEALQAARTHSAIIPFTIDWSLLDA